MPPTEKQVNEFEEKAFTVIKGFFSLDEMMKFSPGKTNYGTNKPSGGEEVKYYEASPITGENILVRVENMIGDHNRMASDLLNKNAWSYYMKAVSVGWSRCVFDYFK